MSKLINVQKRRHNKQTNSHVPLGETPGSLNNTVKDVQDRSNAADHELRRANCEQFEFSKETFRH